MKTKEFIGIDISKLKFDVRIHSNQVSAVFENTNTGFTKMINWVVKNTTCEKDELLFALEHTGIYSLPISIYFTENNLNFILIPGLEIKRSMGIQRGIDDKVDAKRFAVYAYQKKDKLKPSTLPCKNILQIRRLLSLRERLVKQRAGFLKDKKENSRFLKRCENVVLFKITDEMITKFTKEIEKVEKELNELIKSNDLINQQYQLVTSINGIGKQTALNVIAFTDCFTKFDNWRQFASYAGTAPFPYQSGTSIKGKYKVSNLANKKLKTLLNMCARSALLCNPEMKIYFDKRKAEGANGMSVMNIIRNKLIARIFAVVKRETPYINTFKYVA